MTGIVTQGLNLGVEFTGGRVLDYQVSKPITADAARTVVTDAGFPSAVVQETGGESGDQNNITVRTDKISDDEAVKIENALDEAAGATAHAKLHPPRSAHNAQRYAYGGATFGASSSIGAYICRHEVRPESESVASVTPW